MKTKLHLLASIAGMLALSGCGGQAGQQQASAGQIRVVEATESTSAPAASALAVTATPDFSAVKAAVDSSPLNNLSVVIGNKDGLLYQYEKGNFAPSKLTVIYSATKWLTAATAMRMVQAGKMTLADKPQQYLSYWTSSPSDQRSTVNLTQLLALTSGFNNSALLNGCVDSALYTLQSCAKNIYNGNVKTVPGSTFYYGAYHLQVAAAMAEMAGGGPKFVDLFATYLTAPLGMTGTRFVKASQSNPWAAAGVETSALDYAKFLQALLAGTFITDLDDFSAPRTLGLTKGYSPSTTADSSDWEYALGNWVECDKGRGGTNFATLCAADKINSAPGAYGFVPWIDRKNGYYAIIARSALNGFDASVTLEQQLQPLIVNALTGAN
ncbi:MAG: serine hydrolase domain-containing protein [Pseudomonadota bacterium]